MVLNIILLGSLRLFLYDKFSQRGFSFFRNGYLNTSFPLNLVIEEGSDNFRNRSIADCILQGGQTCGGTGVHR